MAVAVFTANQQVALALPPLPDPISKNGVALSLSDFIGSALLTRNNNTYGALYLIFQFLASEDFLGGEKLDQYDYRKREMMIEGDMMTMQGAAEYYRRLYTASNFVAAAPTMTPGGILGLPWWPLPPAVR